jgi:hypothetical protein
MMAQLEACVARLGADGAAFGKELRPVVAATLKAQGTARDLSDSAKACLPKHHRGRSVTRTQG